MARFAGRRVLVTGGSQGLGRACAEAFAAEGAEVLINFARDEAAADASVAAIERAGGTARAVQADLGDAEALARLWAEATATGPLDVLVLNAAFQRKAMMAETDRDLLARTFAVNVFAAVDLGQRFVAQRRRGSSIVVHGSNQGEFVNPTGFAYGMSKAALHHFVRHAARAAVGDGIRVNGVILGWFETEGERRFYGVEQMRAQAATGVPMGRAGDPPEAARLTLFLASDEASYMTGSLVRCDGGFALAPDLGT